MRTASIISMVASVALLGCTSDPTQVSQSNPESLSNPFLEANSSAISSLGVGYAKAGGRSNGDSKLVLVGRSNDSAAIRSMFQRMQDCSFEQQRIFAWDRIYYIVFLSKDGDVVAAANCYHDSFTRVEVYRDQWGYHVGMSWKVNGIKGQRATLKGLEAVVGKATGLGYLPSDG